MEYFVKNRLVRYVLSFVGIGCCASGLSQEMSVPTQLRCDLLLQTDYQSAYVCCSDRMESGTVGQA